MTLETLEARIDEAVSSAVIHAELCGSFITQNKLAEALDFCARANIDPPQCSLSAQSENASRLRASAAQKLSNPKWWKKALETAAIRGYEVEQMALGNVRNYISDGLAEYTAKCKSKK